MVEGKVEYLQMIQEPISRMSTCSAIFKGFAATIVTGVSALSYSDLSIWVMVLSFLPVIGFTVIDLYYLALERKYRQLYESVRNNKHEIDFSMKLTKNKAELKEAKARVIDCIKSPSIILFYPLLIGVLITVTILKLKGVI